MTSPFNRWVSLQFILTLFVRGDENVLPSEFKFKFKLYSASLTELAIRESKGRFNRFVKLVIRALYTSLPASLTEEDGMDLELFRVFKTRVERSVTK